MTTDPGKPIWTAWAETITKERGDNNRLDSPKARCLPSNVTYFGPLWEFVQSKDRMVWISDDDTPGFHQILINQEHPKDVNPGWYGHAVAKWDGDTLVVDRIGFDDRNWLERPGGMRGKLFADLPSFAWDNVQHLFQPAMTIALLAAIESLLCAVVASC